MDVLFKVFRVDVEEAIRLSSGTNLPHHHNYEELIIGIEGSLEHFIDFKSEVLQAPFISFVTKGKIHRVTPKIVANKCDLWVIRFKSEFIPETTFQLYSLYHDNANIQLQKDYCFKRLEVLCQLMQEEMQNELPDYAVIRHLLSALFTMIESERRKHSPNEDVLSKTQSQTFKNFLRILEDNFRRPEGVEFYADKLFMSSRNLNLICQHILQQSVSEIIETRKLIEAKNLLVSTDKTVSEIGYELGYNEKSYFSNVFKKKAGQTPSDFRDEMKSLVS